MFIMVHQNDFMLWHLKDSYMYAKNKGSMLTISPNNLSNITIINCFF